MAASPTHMEDGVDVSNCLSVLELRKDVGPNRTGKSESSARDATCGVQTCVTAGGPVWTGRSRRRCPSRRLDGDVDTETLRPRLNIEGSSEAANPAHRRKSPTVFPTDLITDKGGHSTRSGSAPPYPLPHRLCGLW